jgi:hypothetical protein
MERMEILQKLAAGEITAEEAERLLHESPQKAEPDAQPEAREEAAKEEPESSGDSPHIRWLHVRVRDLETQREHVRINVPIGLFWPGWWFGPQFGHWFTRRKWWWWWDELEDALEEGASGTLVDVDNVEKGKHVHVYIDQNRD